MLHEFTPPKTKLPWDIRLPVTLWFLLILILYYVNLPWQNEIAIAGVFFAMWAGWMTYKESTATDEYLKRVAEAMVASVPGPLATRINRVWMWGVTLFVVATYLSFEQRVWNNFHSALYKDYIRFFADAVLVLLVAAAAGLLAYGSFWVFERAFERVKQSATLSDEDKLSAVRYAFRLMNFSFMFVGLALGLPILIWLPE